MTSDNEAVRNRDKETIRLLSELLDQVADAARLPEKDRGEPDALVETIEILVEEHQQMKAALALRPAPVSAVWECSEPVFEAAIQAYAKAYREGSCPDHCVAMAADAVWQAAIASQPRVTENEARLVEATRVYYSLYMQDEADSADNCTCGEQQHRHAIAVRDALQPYLNVRES